MDFLYSVGMGEANLSLLILFRFGLLDETGIHFLKFVAFPADSFS